MHIRNRVIGFAIAVMLPTLALADSCRTDCGKVVSVHEEKREGKGSAVGLVGGAVVGGLLGNQVGKGKGNTLATVAGAAGGAYAGREVEKKATEKKVQVVTVKMDDGKTRKFEYENASQFADGDRVHVVNNKLQRFTGK